MTDHVDGSHVDGSHVDGSHVDGSHVDGSHVDGARDGGHPEPAGLDLPHRRAAARDARAAVARARQLRPDRAGNTPFTNWYTAAVGVGTLAAMLLSGSAGLARTARCPTGDACPAGAVDATVLAAPMLVLALGAAVSMTAWYGPVGAGAAALSWLHAGPADRRTLLTGRVLAVTGLAATAGGLVGALGGSLLGRPDGLVPSVVVLAAAAGALLTVGLGTVGVWLQTRPGRPDQLARIGTALVVIGGVWTAFAAVRSSASVVVAEVAGAATSPPSALGDVVAGVLLAAVVSTAVLIAGLVQLARAALTGVPVRELRRGGVATSALEASLLMLDASAWRTWSQQRRIQRHARVRSRPGWSRGAAALAHRDALRLARRADLVWRAIPSLAVGAVAAAAGGPSVGVAVTAVFAGSLAVAMADGYLAWRGSAGLRRTLPLPTWSVASALLAGPTVALVLWALLVTAAAGAPWWQAAVLAAAGVSGVLLAGVPPPPHQLGTMVSTPMGAVSTGLAAQTGRGLTPALCAVPLLVTSSPWGLLGTAVVLAAFMMRAFAR